MLLKLGLCMKILALDLGDAWVGSAISDYLGITCKPFQTVVKADLERFLAKTIAEQDIGTVVVGYPKTLSGGTESAQTEKIVAEKDALANLFAQVGGRDITWVLWDERMSSKYADGLRKGGTKTKEDKMQSHSIAAAFILQNYLDSQAFKRSF